MNKKNSSITTMQQKAEPTKSNWNKSSTKIQSKKVDGIFATADMTAGGCSETRVSSDKPAIAPYKKDVRKIFVGGIGKLVNTENFKQFFEQFGEVIDSIVMIDRGTDRHRGFGFVTFKNPNVAKNVLSKGNEGKPVPKGGWKQGHLDIFGKMCEVKVCEPKKGLVGNRMNERHSKNRSSSSSETYAGLIPSNIQILAGHQNVHDVQYGLESSIIPPSLPYVMYPPVVQGPHAGGLSLRHDNSIQLYDYSYAGGMYEHYPESYYQGVYHHYYMPPEGSYDYGYPDFYLGMQPQYPTLPGMALPTYSNEESVPCADFGDTPTLTRERQGKQAEK